MSPALITVPLDASLSTVRDKLRAHLVRHVLVLDADDRLAGIVSVSDLAALDRTGASAREGCSCRSDLCDCPESGDRQRTTGCGCAGVSCPSPTCRLTAVDVMTSNPVALHPDDGIGLATELFLSRTLHAAPVVDDGELIGIVTSHDLLRRVYSDVLAFRT